MSGIYGMKHFGNQNQLKYGNKTLYLYLATPSFIGYSGVRQNTNTFRVKCWPC